MTFREFKTFDEAIKYLKEQGADLEGNPKKNIKFLFEKRAENGMAIGVQTQFCPLCNKTSDGGGFMCVSREKLKEIEQEDTLKMMCCSCMELSKLLITEYGFDDKQVHIVMALIRKIKEEKGI